MGTILSYVGSPGTVAAASGGKVLAFNNIGTVQVQIANANPQRQNITFHNPSTTITCYVYPGVNAAGAPLLPSLAALGGSFTVLPQYTLIITGECQTTWGAFASSGSGNPLTVMESNI